MPFNSEDMSRKYRPVKIGQSVREIREEETLSLTLLSVWNSPSLTTGTVSIRTEHIKAEFDSVLSGYANPYYKI